MSSRVAQRKRAGPITQRSMDRNHPLLALMFCFRLPVLSAVFFGCEDSGVAGARTVVLPKILETCSATGASKGRTERCAVRCLQPFQCHLKVS